MNVSLNLDFFKEIRTFFVCAILNVTLLAILPMQCGSFRGATQKGLKIGTIRDVLPHVIGGELPRKEGEFNLTECK